jgi:DNA primase
MIPESVIEDVRARLDAVAVIGRHTKLRKSGSSFVGTCPFHAEKNPSFRVYAEKKRFRCYGCGAHGDVFEFLQKLQGKEFPVVVRELAVEVGVDVPEKKTPAHLEALRQEKAGALAACEASATHWTEQLWGAAGDDARRYLNSRGVNDAIAREFRLGAAARGWHDLHRAVAGNNGLSKADLERAGLVLDKGKGVYDRFRDRLIFPVADLDGRVIGFGGRALGHEPGPKYINTPETLLYKKSRVLFGISQAKDAIRKTGGAVLVEGYFDVLLPHQAGIRNVVGVCGTALTPEHLELLKRCDCREIVILFDGDAAGAGAPPQVAAAIFEAGLSARVARLQGDPDEYVRAHGRAGFEALVAAAPALTEHLIDQAIQRHTGTAAATHASVEQKIAIVRTLTPHAFALPDGLARSAFERRIAQRLALDVGALRAEVQRLRV